MATELTHARLLQFVSYEPDSGRFVHLVRSGKARAGSEAGWVNNTCGYRYITIDGKRFSAHRLAWLYVFGSWPVGQIDHINGERTDNRLSNLRDVDSAINHQNMRRPHRDNKVGVLGVRQFGQVFTSCIYADGRLRHLGTFGSAQEAGLAYVEAKRRLHRGNTL